MSGSKKDNIFFERGAINEASMLAYLNNQLSAEEKQQFEKLLKDDPFAQEALEGLQVSQSQTTVSTTLVSLNKKIRERTGLKEKKTFQIHWSNYAWAAVLLGLLIGIGFVMINFIGKHDSNIAMNKEEVTKTADENLFETKQELKPAETPVTIITDSVQTVLPDIMKADEAKDKDATLKALDNTEAKNAAKEDVSSKGKEGTSTATPTSATGASSNSIVSVTDKNTAGAVSPAAAEGVNEPSKNVKSNRMADNKTEGREVVTAPATQKVVRGSIVEREEVGNVTVITVNDAMKNFNSGNYKESSEQFDAILQQHPTNADALYFGGISDYINGNARKSEKNFDRLLKDGTKFMEGSKWYKANILIQKGKREEAKKLLDELSQSSGSYKERATKKKAELEF